MVNLPDVRKYLYWSERRVRSLVDDNGIRLLGTGVTTIKSPAAPLLPQVEYQTARQSLTRHEIASAVEKYLAGVTETEFVRPPPARYAAGHGTVLFSEFIDFSGAAAKMVSVFTETQNDRGEHIAICMFGSKDHLTEVITDSSPDQDGWSSSAAPAIVKFFQGRCAEPDSLWGDRATLAQEAVHAVRYAGNSSSEDGIADTPWRRSFSYGHIGEVGEWLAEVYFDVEFNRGSNKFEYEYDRVLIGAPLWVRTPSMRALRLYDEYSANELESFHSPLVSRLRRLRTNLRRMLRRGGTRT